MSRRNKKYFIWIAAGAILVGGLFILQHFYNRYLYDHSEAGMSVVDRTWLNYSEDVLEAAEEYDLPPEYILALIALECEGFSKPSSRFESHVFKKLKKVRDGEMDAFEGITKEDLEESSDEALHNLASSWGPCQLMGYQCLHLGIKIKQLRGDRSVEYSCRWIRETYGKYLDQKRYKDAFHLHNTGDAYPKIGPPRTHSRYYVSKGLKYMKKFRTLIQEKEGTTP